MELLLPSYVLTCELEGLHNDEIPALVDSISCLLAARNCGVGSLSVDLAYSSPLQAGRHYSRRLISAHQGTIYAAGKSLARTVGTRNSRGKRKSTYAPLKEIGTYPSVHRELSHKRLHKPLKVSVRHFQKFAVVASVECNLLIVP